MSNRKLTLRQIRALIKCFCLDLSATQAAKYIHINRNTVNAWYMTFRTNIYSDQIKLRTHIFKDDQITNRMNQNCTDTQTAILAVYESRQYIFIDLTISSDRKILKEMIFSRKKNNEPIKHNNYFHYHGLIDIKSSKCIVLYQDYDYRSEIKLFWHFCEKRLAKFNGVASCFDLHLKECEWRWKNVKKLNKQLLALLKRNQVL